MLPAISYLVESDDGWAASCYARFQQARRHSQGVAELSYMMLQYVSLVKAASFRELPWRTHRGIIALMGKLTFVHIINSLHAGAMCFTSCALFASVLRWFVTGGLQSIMLDVEMHGFVAVCGGIIEANSSSWSSKWLATAISPVPVVCFLLTTTTFLVIRDTLEGRYTTVASSQQDDAHGDVCTEKMQAVVDAPLMPVAGEVSGSVRGSSGGGIGTLGFWKSAKLFLNINSEYTLAGEATIVIYSLVPVTLALWSLMVSGPQFDYVVAPKPNKA
jgi:hypothetical protein